MCLRKAPTQIDTLGRFHDIMICFLGHDDFFLSIKHCFLVYRHAVVYGVCDVPEPEGEIRGSPDEC